MSNRRPPWWVLLALLGSTAWSLSFLYVCVAGPEADGFLSAVRPEGHAVLAVQPGGAADRAGLRPHDVILSINGVAGRGGGRQLALAWPGKALELVVRRGAARETLTLRFERKPLSSWTTREGALQFADLVLVLLGTALAWLTALRRPDDTVALFGAVMLAYWPLGIVENEHGAPPGMFTLWTMLPGKLAVVPMATIAFAGSLFLMLVTMFVASFPGERIRGRWIWLPLCVPAATAFLFLADRWYSNIFGTPIRLDLPSPVLGLLFRTSILPFLAWPVLLAWNYHRSENDLNAQRRLRVLMIGIILTTAARLTHFVLLLGPAAALAAFHRSSWYIATSIGAIGGPCALAYAILRHRMFDLKVIIRQGLQYTAARHVLLALAPLCGALMIADLALHSDQTMAEAFVRRGWTYVVLGAAALLAHARRATWLDHLDRRFFRERYNAQRVLRGVLADIRQARALAEAAPHAIARINEALHPTFAAIVRRDVGERMFRPVASFGPAIPEITADSKLIGLLRVLGKPLENQQSDKSWLRQQLPPDESRWLKETPIEWIFPIALGAGVPETLLVLGPKRSEEPYSREDQELLEGVTSGLGLLDERLSSASLARAATALTHLSAVPTLATRYVLGRELGRGGMGTVYEATDTELERGVAIKVMRPDLGASEEALGRFKREARAAAGLPHPNVVTVYDVGVADDGRAYLVMELLAGETVRQALRRETRFSAARTGTIMRGVCAAVDAAHRHHLLHRDLKPENVFLARSGDTEVPKILDFGVAKLLEAAEETVRQHDTAPGQLLGTLAYMSPEQLRGLPASPGWDLWALGVMAYEMLTGAHPFASAGQVVGIAGISTRRITPTAAHGLDQGDRLDAFFARALSPEVAERPATVPEWLVAFESIMVEIGARAPVTS